VNGRIDQYEFYVSTDGVDWGSPVATGTFANDASEKEVLFAPVTGQFVRLVALSEANGNPWTSMAEFNILGDPLTGNYPPNGAIDIPFADVTIDVGDWVEFAGTGTDPDGDLPLSFLWNFGDPAIADSTEEAPGPVPGTYTVIFTVTDDLGLSDPTPATRIITVLRPIVPQTDWNLWYVDSEELVAEDGAAVNAFDGNINTFWHTQWRGDPDPPHPHEIQIDPGAYYNIDGFRYLPRQDGGVNGRIDQYEFYVSTDGVDWGSPVATGTFANNAAEKEVLFAPVTGQFVRLVALSEVNGNPWTSMAELNILGNLSTGNQAPNGVIDLPAGDVTIDVGDWVDFAGTGNDPDGDFLLTYVWNFGDPAIADSTDEDPGLVQFNNAGLEIPSCFALQTPDFSPCAARSHDM